MIKRLKFLLMVSVLALAGCTIVSGYKFDYNAVGRIELGSSLKTVEDVLRGKPIEVIQVGDGSIAKWEYAVNDPEVGWPYIRTVKLAFDRNDRLVRAIEINGIEISEQDRKRLLPRK